MRRLLLCLLISLLAVGGVPTTAIAVDDSPRPRLRLTDWPPNGAGAQPWVEQGEVVSWMEGGDPDGIISEVEVRWADEAIAFAHTYCVQGTEPGTVATMGIGHAF